MNMPVWLIELLMIVFYVIPIIAGVVYIVLAVSWMQICEEEEQNGQA